MELLHYIMIASDFVLRKKNKKNKKKKGRDFPVRDFFSKYDQISRTWSNLLKKSLMENFIFCAVLGAKTDVVRILSRA